MSKVKRVYVEKQAPYAVKAKELKEEFKDFSLNYIEQCPLEKVS